MAQLQSPGVSVTVIDESFYTPSAPGTVPLIVVASAENKQNGSGTGIAPGTLKANAGQVYLMTSQKDLSDTFGTPIFQTDANNNPVHAGELNEYGLQAAYSFLGVSNSAYVVRGDIDLSQLEESADAPAGLPVDGTVWIDTADTQYGIFQWDANPATVAGGQSFTVQKPSVITDPNYVVDFAGQDYTPKASFGAIGSYAIVAVSGLINLWFKKPITTSASGVKWVEVGSTEWVASWPTAQGSKLQSAITVGSSDTLTINTTTITMTSVTNLSTLVTAINAQTTTTKISAGIVNNKLQLFSTGPNLVISGSAAIATGILATGETTGTFLAPALQISSHTQIPLFKAIDNTGSNNGIASGAVWIKTTTPNSGAHWFVNQYNSKAAQWTPATVSLYANNIDAIDGLDAIGGGINLPINTMYVKYNDSGATVTQNSIVHPQYADFKLYRRASVGPTTVTSAIVTNSTFAANTYTFTIAENSDSAKSLSFTVTNGDTAVTVIEAIVSQINAAGFTNVVASATTTNQVVISHIKGGEITFVDGSHTPVSKLYSVTSTANFYAAPSGIAGTYVASNWSSVSSTDKTKSFATASSNAPTTLTANGQLWYNGNIEDVDILVHNGTTWVGYRNVNLGNGVGATDSQGPIVSATAPTTQSDGLTELKNGDLWISTADLENYPLIYKYDYLTKQWVLVDNSDQTTENGVLFHDARWDTNGRSANPSSIVDLLTSNFLDPDAPNPALYPKGMLLWNLRRSGFNIKKYVYNYIDVLSNNQRYNNDELMSNYYPHRWISEAANQADGSGSFGRIAQRTVVLQSLTELVNSNQQIRDEDNRVFNLIAAPGYSELIKPLISLNYDRGLTAFIVGDTPARLTPDATTLSNWGNNINNALEDNADGLVSTDPYLGVFYPWGYTTDNIGNHISVPPSHMMLRTIALSDNVSYPWFAPAGVRRGGITNASSVGYIDAEGEFRSVALNNGQRDTLANIHVNPITYISGTGLVNYGQKTRQLVASSLDRINVARLVIYLRVQLSRIAKPYIFEPNDTITRNEIKQQIESFLLELVGQRALYDYLVVCDTSNNTPSRIDANELYVDIAIEPVKAVEFIYIPLRLENTGAIAKLGQA
jgi:hypothetical protein